MSLPSSNIELKARLESLDAARQVAERMATSRLGVQHQIDTYFHCTTGRLKLREIDLPPLAQLIAYQRSDTAEAKASDYRLTSVTNPADLKATLAAALGLLLVVEKRREIFLHHNVRIHLDEVAGLGTFLEFEAVLGPDVDAAQGFAQVARLRKEFAIRDEQLVDRSYSDLLGTDLHVSPLNI